LQIESALVPIPFFITKIILPSILINYELQSVMYAYSLTSNS
jgi:hypothetical protein